MSFADTYLKRYSSGSIAVLEPPDPDLFFSVVIPVFNEPYLLDCLNSLISANTTGLACEIILIINQAEGAINTHIDQNKISKVETMAWAEKSLPENWNIHVVNPLPFPLSKAGPGMARKIGMDLAVSRYNSLKKPDGVIISMDADTLVGANYFIELHNLFSSQTQANACTVYFEHLRNFRGRIVPNIQALQEYEIYLRMVKLGLSWAGYPLAIHTLGSAFALRSSAYVKSGGMGTQQAGEDFYFLHKCIQLGDFWENNEAQVFPAGRESDRVQFGTGPFIRDYNIQHPKGYHKYSWKAFEDLKNILDKLKHIEYSKAESGLNSVIDSIDDRIFLELLWGKKINRAFKQAGNTRSFIKWMWRELDGLQIVRYLNLHQSIFGSQNVVQTSCTLLDNLGFSSCPQNANLVLKKMRKLERERGLTRIY